MPLEASVFYYLDRLRESGKVNMFEAVPYLMQEFGLKRKSAKRWLLRWMASKVKD